MKTKDKIIIFGHRGASSFAPENTLKAFKKAIELKADYIEFDVQESKDGELVIIHDPTTTRMSGQEHLVKELTLEELKTLDMGEGEEIPTLKELITLAKDRIGLLCEIKSLGLSNRLIKLLHQENFIDDTIICSYMIAELLEVQKLECNIKLAINVRTSRWLKRHAQKAIENKFYAIHPYYKLVDEDFVKFAHESGLIVNVWFVTNDLDKVDIEKMVKIGVDGIIGNNIEQVRMFIRNVQ